MSVFVPRMRKKTVKLATSKGFAVKCPRNCARNRVQSLPWKSSNRQDPGGGQHGKRHSPSVSCTDHVLPRLASVCAGSTEPLRLRISPRCDQPESAQFVLYSF